MKALARTMVGIPSQLGYQIVDDICRKSTKLTGCCCAGAAHAIWSMQLPVNIRAHISDREFNKQTYKSVFEAADKCFQSSKQLNVSVAAVSLDETQPGFFEQNLPQVAAVARGGSGTASGGGGKPPKNKNNKGQNQGNKNQNSRGKKHSSVPEDKADKMCDRHYRHGASAWYCLKPQSCPWASRTTDKP